VKVVRRIPWQLPAAALLLVLGGLRLLAGGL